MWRKNARTGRSRVNIVVKRLCKYKMTSGALSGCQIKVVTAKSLKADVSSVRAIDEGLTLKTSAFKLLTVANSRFQLSW